MNEWKDYQVEAAYRVYGNRAGWTGPDDSIAAHKDLMRKALEAALSAKPPCQHLPIVMICEFDHHTTKATWCLKCNERLSDAPEGASKPMCTLPWFPRMSRPGAAIPTDDPRSGKDRRHYQSTGYRGMYIRTMADGSSRWETGSRNEGMNRRSGQVAP